MYKETAGLVKLPVQFTGEPKAYPITFDIIATVQGGSDELETILHFTQTEGQIWEENNYLMRKRFFRN